MRGLSCRIRKQEDSSQERSGLEGSFLPTGMLHPPQGLCTCCACCLIAFVPVTLQEITIALWAGPITFLHIDIRPVLMQA